MSINDQEREALVRIDDLVAALVLMTRLNLLVERLGEKERSILLQILVDRFIVDMQEKSLIADSMPHLSFFETLLKNCTH